MSTTPQVWIGCLASYNAGRLIGEWVDADDLDGMNECWERVKAKAVEAAKRAGEYPVYFGEPEEPFIADYDGFGDVRLGEYPSWERVVEVCNAIEEHGADVVEWAMDQWGVDTDLDSLGDHVRGEFDSEEAFAMEFHCEVGLAGLPAHFPKLDRYGFSHTETVNIIDELSSYIDWETVARELFQHGNFDAIPRSGGRVLVMEEEI